jgi:PPE family protein
MTDTTTPPPAEETPVAGDPAEETRWRGFTHKELYLMLHDGPGASASAAPSRRWQEISTTLTEIGEDLKKALDLTGSGWQGKAAGAAYDRLSTTVSWANSAGASAGIMRTAVEDQGDHIAKARADMPAPEGVTPVAPDPTIAPAVQVLQTQVDAEPAESGASSAEERAVEVMAAYENNSKTTTASLASFDMPQKLLPETGMHQGKGGGLLGILPTVVSGLLPGGGPSRHDHPHSDWRGPKDNWHGQTGGSSAHWEERRPLPAAPQAPGKTMGVSREPLLAPRIMSSTGGNQERAANKAPANGSSSGHGPLPQKASPTANVNLPHGDQQFQQAQAAAASQAAASAHPGAGAPIAPTTGGVSGGQEKLALRRFGMDAIGSSQWFGDSDEPAVGESPKRRFDLRESADVTESVSILDEEHKLPPTVIGEGGR